MKTQSQNLLKRKHPLNSKVDRKPPFSIRLAQQTDAKAVSALIIGLSDFFAISSSTQNADKFWQSVSPKAVAERISSDSYVCYVAENPSGLCGFVALRGRSHLYHLFVAEHSHRQGLARLLWRKILDHANKPKITVNSSVYAVPVYERLGFIKTEPERCEDGITFVPMVFKTENWQSIQPDV